MSIGTDDGYIVNGKLDFIPAQQFQNTSHQLDLLRVALVSPLAFPAFQLTIVSIVSIVLVAEPFHFDRARVSLGAVLGQNFDGHITRAAGMVFVLISDQTHQALVID